MTSPPSPQPKQWQNPRAGVTWNDGDFSSWNGHRPFMRAAAGVAEGDVAGDDLVDACLLAHLRDVLLTDPAGHAAESMRGRPRRTAAVDGLPAAWHPSGWSGPSRRVRMD